MDIQQYIAADKELLLNLNGSQSLFWDGFMWVATSTIVWVPVAAMLLYIIIKNNKIQEALEEDDLASYPVMLPTHLLFLSFYLY